MFKNVPKCFKKFEQKFLSLPGLEPEIFSWEFNALVIELAELSANN
jgi:hypothetical protein